MNDAQPATVEAVGPAREPRGPGRHSALVDLRGCPVSTPSVEAIEHAEVAQWRLLSFFGDPLEALDAAIAEDPRWPLPHLMKANALLFMTEHGLAELARTCLDQAVALAPQANERERAHLGATRLCLRGQWAQACDAWERILVDYPQDLVALGAAHLFDFYRGDARNLQRRVTRVLPRWSTSAPLYSFVLGMHAFGLEENNHYALAQEAGEAALSLDRRDPWAVHAVAHVHEMQGRFDAGSAWLQGRVDDWSPDNAFAYHNWWHLALFHLERGDTASALSLLDDHVAPGTELALQRDRRHCAALEASVDGRRAGRTLGCQRRCVADPLARGGVLCFNDLHAALAHDRRRSPRRGVASLSAVQLTSPALQAAGLPDHIVFHRGFKDVWDTRVRVAYWIRERLRLGAALRFETSAVSPVTSIRRRSTPSSSSRWSWPSCA